MTTVSQQTSPQSRAWIEQVLAEHQAPLLRYAASIAGREAATDIVQEAFLRLCRTPREQVESYVAPWLFRVCRNLAIDAGRDRARYLSMEHDKEERSGGKASPSPADQFEQSEAAARALRAMEKLTDKQREAVRLKFAAGLSYKEIADVLDTSVNNVGVLLHRALKEMRGHLEMDSARKLEVAR